MKNKSWIIILIMGIALAISIGYSINLSKKASEKESTVTTTSIIEMTATTATIKNTLTGSGTIEYKDEITLENTETENYSQQPITDEDNNTQQETEKVKNKTYQIKLSIEDKDLEKVKVGQEVEISIKKENEALNYIGQVKKIDKDANNKSSLIIEFINADIRVEVGSTATCKVIIEKAENVVALPVEAIQKNEDNKEYVDVVQADGSTKSTLIKTGLSDDYYVDITSGLNVGDRVQIVKSSTTVVNNKNKLEDQ